MKTRRKAHGTPVCGLYIEMFYILQYCIESQVRQRGYDPATSLICIKPRSVTTRRLHYESFWTSTVYYTVKHIYDALPTET